LTGVRDPAGGAILLHGRFLDTAANANAFGDAFHGYTDLTLTF